MSRNFIPPALTQDERKRYARHLLLPDVGDMGQLKLKAARVLLIGLGGLGSPIALYLAAAGVGTLGLVDADDVDLSNLQRQIMYGTADIGRPKTEAAMGRLRDINPHVNLIPHAEKFTAANAARLLQDYDIIVDGTDNFSSHYLINDSCVKAQKILVYGSVARFDGMVATVVPQHSACYRCLYPTPPPPDLIPNCAEAGVLGVVPGLIGMLQATEVVKLILGIGAPLTGRVMLVDSLATGFREITVPRDPACPACGSNPSPQKTETHMTIAEITAEQLKAEMASGSSPFILDVRNQDEFDECRIEGSHLIPLPVLAARFGELDPACDMVVHCKLGGRSAKAIQFLQSKGFTKLRNLAGGMEAYKACKE